jgi:DNA gyrase/topoisomerase IV subunit A
VQSTTTNNLFFSQERRSYCDGLSPKGFYRIDGYRIRFAKRTPVKEYRLTSRGGKGIINIKVTKKNGEAVSLKTVSDKDELMVISNKGKLSDCEPWTSLFKDEARKG